MGKLHLFPSRAFFPVHLPLYLPGDTTLLTLLVTKGTEVFLTNQFCDLSWVSYSLTQF